MTPKDIVDKVVNNHPENGWAIFKYNLKFAISRIIFRCFFLAVVLVMAATFSYSAINTEQTVYMFLAIISVLFSLASFISILFVLIELLYIKKNMIVITNEGVMKSFKNNLEFFPFECITNLNATNQYSAGTPAIAKRMNQYIDFRDSRDGKFVNLVKYRIFGNPEPIFAILKSRIKLDSFVSVQNSNFNN